MVGYVVATLLSVWWLELGRRDLAARVVALLPVPPVALAMRAIMRYIRDADELQRRIELEAVSFATACVSLRLPRRRFPAAGEGDRHSVRRGDDLGVPAGVPGLRGGQVVDRAALP